MPRKKPPPPVKLTAFVTVEFGPDYVLKSASAQLVHNGATVLERDAEWMDEHVRAALWDAVQDARNRGES